MKQIVLLIVFTFLLLQSASAECIELPALMDYLAEWKQGNIDMVTLMEKIGNWKTGAGCEPAYCGDQICNGEENCSTCPEDCPCSGQTPHCTEGNCAECLEAIHCDDNKTCTDDNCMEGECTNTLDDSKCQESEVCEPESPKADSQTGCAEVSTGRTYYCDPVNGNTETGDGSKEKPWGTLQSVFEARKVQWRQYPDAGIKNPDAPVKAGDTIKLMSGYHGVITANVVGGRGFHNDDYVTIEGEAGETPAISKVLAYGWSYWKFKNITFQHEPGKDPDGSNGFDIKNGGAFGDSHHITIEHCTVQPASDSETNTWSKSDWLAKSDNGIDIDGHDHVVRYNTIKNVKMGVITGGENTVVEHNTIDRFCHDGLRMESGDNQSWQYNLVKNSLGVDGNHDDLLQWYDGAEPDVYNVTISNNTFLGHDDLSMPYIGSSQGLYIGSAFAYNWTIENNLIACSSHWGIGIKSPQNCKIVNNTVIREPDSLENFPSIDITDNADPDSYNCLVKNNIAVAYSIPENRGHTFESNIEAGELSELQALFVDYNGYDFRPIINGSACDGSVNDQPGVAVGALSCVCTSDSQCETVLGQDSTCTGDESDPGECV